MIQDTKRQSGNHHIRDAIILKIYCAHPCMAALHGVRAKKHRSRALLYSLYVAIIVVTVNFWAAFVEDVTLFARPDVDFFQHYGNTGLMTLLPLAV